MKKLRTSITVILALVMLMALALPAFAADTYEITINQSSSGHRYEAYQIFIGSLSYNEDGDLELSSIKWGTGVNAAGQTALGNAQDIADTLKTEADAKAFADQIAQYLTSTCAKSTYSAANKIYKIGDLQPGYYLIKDENGSLSAEEGYTSYILKVVGNVEVEPKDGETTFTKKVDDKNDSNNMENDLIWLDSADHDIGDAIDFKLEAVITENYDEYDTYYLALHDTEEQGLTFDPSTVAVYVDNVKITSGFKVVTNPTDGCKFEVVFDNLKDIAIVKANSHIVVRYKSVLNEDAILGNMGNVNKAYADFSNNPNNEEDHGKTKEDSVIIFTYQVVINKIDSNNQPLAGAEFTLEKFMVADTGTEEYNGLMGNWVAIDTVESTPGTTFTFRGLDDGVYRLTETKAPEHYNAIDPITFNVTAEHETEWTMDRLDVLTSLTGNVVTGEIKFTADKITGNIGTEIVNERGVILPETGGIGTTIFYIVGGLLVVGAVVFLITKKKMCAVSK